MPVSVRVTPRASRSRVELVGEVLKVYVAAAPTDGQANEAVCETLAKALKLPKTSVLIVKGHTSRDKTVDVGGMTLDQIGELLQQRKLL